MLYWRQYICVQLYDECKLMVTPMWLKTRYIYNCDFSECDDLVHVNAPGKAGIPPGKSDASCGIGPKHIVTSTSGFSARCRPMRPIFPVEFQLQGIYQYQTLMY